MRWRRLRPMVMLVVIPLALVGMGALWFMQADADSVIRTIPFATGAIGGPAALSVDTRDGLALVAGSGTVTMIDSGSGAIRNALALCRPVGRGHGSGTRLCGQSARRGSSHRGGRYGERV